MYPVYGPIFNDPYYRQQQQTIGIHSFCSFCGVHILYSPSLDPLEIHINSDCLDTDNIDYIDYSYYGIPETTGCTNTYEPAANFIKRGEGSNYIPSTTSLINLQLSLDSNNTTKESKESINSNSWIDSLKTNMFGNTTPPELELNEDIKNEFNYMNSNLSESNNQMNETNHQSKSIIEESFSNKYNDDEYETGETKTFSVEDITVNTRVGRSTTVELDTPMHRRLRQHLLHYIQPSNKSLEI